MENNTEYKPHEQSFFLMANEYSLNVNVMDKAAIMHYHGGLIYEL